MSERMEERSQTLNVGSDFVMIDKTIVSSLWQWPTENSTRHTSYVHHYLFSFKSKTQDCLNIDTAVFKIFGLRALFVDRFCCGVTSPHLPPISTGIRRDTFQR